MPLGSPLGLLSFLLLIDNLTVDCLTHNYVDDTTLTELLPRGSQQTHVQTLLQQLHTWATPNKMKINFMKTKEMILGPLVKFSPQHLSDSSANNPATVERVQQCKLLGITISHDMNWQTHIDAIITKASSSLYFLKILKKSGLNSHQLRDFYLLVIRQILKYCSAIWHHGLTKAQAESLIGSHTTPGSWYAL